MGCSSSRPQTDGYVINGFYMSMREKFVAKDASITYLMVEWDEKDLSWGDFRGKVLGATDPAKAEKGSLRATILETYEELGLKSEPNTGDNGVHGSASPFEGLCERMNWAETKMKEDAFGKALLDLKIDQKVIMDWTKDPQIEVDGKKTSLFDFMEDVDASKCLEKAKSVAKAEGDVTAVKNMAFVFIKPHANNEKVLKLVKDKFEELKITVTKEAKIEAAVIDKKLLIDNHYYSIANKASLTKPKDLHVPEKGLKAFEEKFGIKWEEALKKKIVMNAKEACARYKLDATEMNERWAKAKKDGNMLKFGGGFYCGKVFSAPPAEKKEEGKEPAEKKEEGKEPAAADAGEVTDKAKAEEGKPAEEAAKAEEKPAEEAAKAEEKPAEEAAKAEEKPAEEAAKAEEKPAEEQPAKAEEKKSEEAAKAEEKPSEEQPAKAEEKKSEEAAKAEEQPAKAEEKKSEEAAKAEEQPAKAEEKKSEEAPAEAAKE